MITALPEATSESSPIESAPAKVRRAARRWWWVFALAVVLIALSALNATRGTDTNWMSIGNTDPNGAMALANILGDQGVEIVEATSVLELEEYADGETTVFLVRWDSMGPDEREAVAALDADVTIAGSPWGTLATLTEAVETSPLGTTGVTFAQCADPDATAASRISASRGAVDVLPGGQAELCFPSSEGAGLFASWEQAGHTWRYIADASIGTNEQLAEEGNAALMLRSLGGNQRLVWFTHRTPSESLTGGPSELPPWGEPLVAVGALTLLAGAIWQGRRMGRVVIEPLPVVVLPGEAVRGRARLYRSAKAPNHAGSTLRAGTITRLVKRLGLGGTTSPQSLIAAVAAQARRPYDQVGALLYGPLPASETELVTLANELAELEREVHP